jgi:DNA-binding XRE family transcriptional regulator
MRGKHQRGLALPNLATWRRARPWTQKELAAHAGVSRLTVVRCEGGEAVNISTARKLAEALEVTVQQLQHVAPGAD